MYAHLNQVSQNYQYIPPKAFLFQPQNKNPNIQNCQLQQIETDDFVIKTGPKSIRRVLFEGNTKYSKFQQAKLLEFQQYLSRKKISVDKRWDRSWRLRFLQSTGYNNKQTVQDMQNFIQYQEQNKQIHLTDTVKKCLETGVYYVAGRDSKFRPILILDVKKMIKIKMSEKEIKECQVYFFEFIIRNLMIPGQVENWITLIDVGYEGVMSMMGPMKSSIGFLQSTFRARMFVAYIIRPSGTCSFLWSIAQNFLQEDTKKKVVFVDGQTMTQLLQFCNQEQLEQKFGGKQPNLKKGQFWPPKEFSENYESKTQVRLLSEEMYRSYYKEGLFKDTKIYKLFIQTYEEKQQHNQILTEQQLEKQLVQNLLLFEQTEKVTIEQLQQLNLLNLQAGKLTYDIQHRQLTDWFDLKPK